MSSIEVQKTVRFFVFCAPGTSCAVKWPKSIVGAVVKKQAKQRSKEETKVDTDRVGHLSCAVENCCRPADREIDQMSFREEAIMTVTL